mmetsp:Transcript_51183/g.105272  ORF Transcript_51183/g.105272 Transcript_51183/m.105272 type:complete len:439 (-) Transcript_51183:90-1406(-)
MTPKRLVALCLTVLSALMARADEATCTAGSASCSEADIEAAEEALTSQMRIELLQVQAKVKDPPSWCSNVPEAYMANIPACANSLLQKIRQTAPDWCTNIPEVARPNVPDCAASLLQQAPSWCSDIPQAYRTHVPDCKSAPVLLQSVPDWCRGIPLVYWTSVPDCAGYGGCVCASWCGYSDRSAWHWESQCCGCLGAFAYSPYGQQAPVAAAPVAAAPVAAAPVAAAPAAAVQQEESPALLSTDEKEPPSWCSNIPEAARPNVPGCVSLLEQPPSWCQNVPEAYRTTVPTCKASLLSKDMKEPPSWCSNVPEVARPNVPGCSSMLLVIPDWCMLIPTDQRWNVSDCAEAPAAMLQQAPTWCANIPESYRPNVPDCKSAPAASTLQLVPDWCKNIPASNWAAIPDCQHGGDCTCASFCSTTDSSTWHWYSQCCGCAGAH